MLAGVRAAIYNFTVFLLHRLKRFYDKLHGKRARRRRRKKRIQTRS